MALEGANRELAIDEGLAMIRRAHAAKEAGAIKDYFVFADKSDPEIVTHIQLVKNDG